MWRSQIGDPTQPAEHDTFKKFKHLSASDCEAALQQLRYANPNESKSTLTPKIKHREYLENFPWISPHWHLTNQDLSTLLFSRDKALRWTMRWRIVILCVSRKTKRLGVSSLQAKSSRPTKLFKKMQMMISTST
mmetsp:Transcript_37475/g.67483  ORF Transcript_37475/g.67483 Transcript_37475/m.67483 type:complete len:134 (-) Transcript_37475:589-990(-)